MYAHKILEAAAAGNVCGLMRGVQFAPLASGLSRAQHFLLDDAWNLPPFNEDIVPKLPFPLITLNFRAPNSDRYVMLCAQGMRADVIAEVGDYIDAFMLLYLDDFVHVIANIHVTAKRFSIRLAHDATDLRPAIEQCAAVVMRFLALLECSNVGMVMNEAPAALNKKRLRNGRPPIFEHWTLHIRCSRNMNAALMHEYVPATRASPVLHLRRGHIRRLNGGAKKIYIDPVMVGDPARGVITKDYLVTH